MNFADEFMPSDKTVCPRLMVRTEVNGRERNGMERNGKTGMKNGTERNGIKKGTERKREVFFGAYCTYCTNVHTNEHF